MRIALVSEHASPRAVVGGVDAGGQNVHVAELARGLAALGAEVVVHTRRDDRELPDRVELCSGVVVDHVTAGPPREIAKDRLLPYMGWFGEELRRRWTDERPDVAHTHFWMSGHASLDVARALGIPLVHTFHAIGVVKRRHQGELDTSPPERQGIELDILRGADRIVSTCSDEVFELLRLGADRSRLVVIPCGVDLGLFGPEPAPGEPPPRGNRIVNVGRIVPRKGVGNLISALERVDGAELVVAGGPPRATLHDDAEVRRLQALAREHGVSERVEFRGQVPRDEVPALLRSAAVVATVPWYEPFGIVPLEAMACGVPVVASAVGGLIDTVVDGVTGVHVPPRDPDRLAEVLCDLLGDPARRRALGAAGVERAQRYDWTKIAGSTLEVYEDALAGRGRRRSRASVGVPTSRQHLQALASGLAGMEERLEQIEGLGRMLAEALLAGARLLVVGNGGSAAQAQHLTAELVGRYRTDRRPLSALCLHGDTSSLTAIGNDFGAVEAFARQVRAHARPGDVLLAISTSGRSANVLAAVDAARECGATTIALTTQTPNELVDRSDHAIGVPATDVATVQELHMVALHLICGVVDREVALRERRDRRRPSAVRQRRGGSVEKVRA